MRATALSQRRPLAAWKSRRTKSHSPQRLFSIRCCYYTATDIPQSWMGASKQSMTLGGQRAGARHSRRVPAVGPVGRDETGDRPEAARNLLVAYLSRPSSIALLRTRSTARAAMPIGIATFGVRRRSALLRPTRPMPRIATSIASWALCEAKQ